MAEEKKVRCGCSCCRASSLMGPALIITVGVIFLIGQYSGRYGFQNLWPLLLVVAGLVKVLSSLSSREGHTGS